MLSVLMSCGSLFDDLHNTTPHATHHTPHATRHTPHATRHTPHATAVREAGERDARRPRRRAGPQLQDFALRRGSREAAVIRRASHVTRQRSRAAHHMSYIIARRASYVLRRVSCGCPRLSRPRLEAVGSPSQAAGRRGQVRRVRHAVRPDEDLHRPRARAATRRSMATDAVCIHVCIHEGIAVS